MEIIQHNDVDSRTIFLFKDHFMKSNEDIDSVLEMYVSIDDLEQFTKAINSINLSAKRF